MDLKKYVTVGDDGKVTFDTDAFNADIDREKTSAINTYSANNSKKLEEEMRKKLEEEARLSAEEKLAQREKEFEEKMLTAYKELAQSKAKTKLENANIFDKEEIAAYLELVNNDESLAKIDSLIAARTKFNENYEKTLKEKLLGGTPVPQSGDQAPILDDGAKFAKQYQAGTKSADTVTAFNNLI